MEGYLSIVADTRASSRSAGSANECASHDPPSRSLRRPRLQPFRDACARRASRRPRVARGASGGSALPHRARRGPGRGRRRCRGPAACGRAADAAPAHDAAHARTRSHRPSRPGGSLRDDDAHSRRRRLPRRSPPTMRRSRPSTASRATTRGVVQRLVVIGMGKLGGEELNVSSDVDLVFVYPDDGETDGARPVSNREFFDRLGRRVIGALRRRDGRRLRLPRRHAAAALWRERTAHRSVRGARAVPDHAGPRVGALRVAQGAAADRRAPRRASRARQRRSSSASTSTTTPTRACATSTGRSASRASGATTRRTSSSDRAASARSSSSCRRCRSCAAGASPRCACAATLPALAAVAARGLLPEAVVASLARRLRLPAQRRAPSPVPRRSADAGPAGGTGRARGARACRGLRRHARIRACTRRASRRGECTVRRGRSAGPPITAMARRIRRRRARLCGRSPAPRGAVAW